MDAVLFSHPVKDKIIVDIFRRLRGHFLCKRDFERQVVDDPQFLDPGRLHIIRTEIKTYVGDRFGYLISFIRIVKTVEDAELNQITGHPALHGIELHQTGVFACEQNCLVKPPDPPVLLAAIENYTYTILRNAVVTYHYGFVKDQVGGNHDVRVKDLKLHRLHPVLSRPAKRINIDGIIIAPIRAVFAASVVNVEPDLRRLLGLGRGQAANDHDKQPCESLTHIRFLFSGSFPQKHSC